MLRSLRPLLAGAVLLAAPGLLAAQGTWVGHQPPCELGTGHYLVKGGVVYLQQAVETRFGDQRDERLAEAHRVLTEAVTGERADDPAAWYYLGRYYDLKDDPAGADSAFRRAEEMVPACAQDIQGYRERVAPLAMNEALRLWGEQQIAPAAEQFALTLALDPDNAEPALYLAVMYAGADQLDSAAHWAQRGIALAGDDTTYARRRKEALKGIAQGWDTRAYRVPTVVQGPQARITRDTLQEAIDRDSVILAEMVGRVADIRAAGRQLDVESRRAFQQESTTVATRLTLRQMARDSVARQAEADSIAGAAVLEPAIAAWRTYVDAYPDEGDAVMKLARLYSAGGHQEALAALIDRVVTEGIVSNADMVQGALSLSNEGQATAARRLLTAVLERNPNDYNALFVLGRLLYTAREGEPLAGVAARLRALDPLSQNTMRTAAMAWDVAGQRDSVQYYLAMADTGVAWNVNVTQFTPQDSSTVLTGAAVNVARRPLPAITLLFEFLDAEGNVVFSEPVSVPALEAGTRERISIRLDRGGAAAWRYRRQ